MKSNEFTKLIENKQQKGRLLKPLFSTLLAFIFSLIFSSTSFALGLSDIIQTAAAYATHVGMHETGHSAMAKMSGANNVRMDFFKNQGNGFFAGVSSADNLNQESMLPFRAAGLAASNYTYDFALRSNRVQENTYNRALMFFSGTDFLWYSIWAFYIKDSQDPGFDPVGIQQETGLSAETIVGVALFQTAVNYYRAQSGDDTYMPYIDVSPKAMQAGLRISF